MRVFSYDRTFLYAFIIVLLFTSLINVFQFHFRTQLHEQQTASNFHVLRKQASTKEAPRKEHDVYPETGVMELDVAKELRVLDHYIQKFQVDKRKKASNTLVASADVIEGEENLSSNLQETVEESKKKYIREENMEEEMHQSKDIDGDDSNADEIVMIIRTIGNSMPPRHKTSQTIENINFILDYEAKSTRLRRHWLLSHIFDPRAFEEIKQLLDERGEEYSILPFSLMDYSKRKFKLLDYNHTQDLMHTNPATSTWYKTLWTSLIYDSKILYAMNTNEARNFNIEYGIAHGAHWILPWDQNSFLNDNAWRELDAKLKEVGRDTKYFVTPMDRLAFNDPVIKLDYKPNAWAEPQVIFRRDALERFHPEFNYARKDKASLIVRLNVSGDWNLWYWDDWERQRSFLNISSDLSNKYRSAPKASWVARLSSGVPSAEKKGSGLHREYLRSLAIKNVVSDLDSRALVQIFKFSPDNLLYYDENLLRKYKQLWSDQVLVDSSAKLVGLEPPLMQVYSDAENSIQEAKYGFPGYQIQVERFNSLSLAWVLTEKKKFLDEAINQLHDWVERMQNRLNGKIVNATLIDLEIIDELAPVSYYFLDAIRLLKNDIMVRDAKLMTSVNKLFTQILAVVAGDDSRSNDNFYFPGLLGFEYDLVMISMAAFVNDTKAVAFHSNTVQGRLFSLFKKNGKWKRARKLDMELPESHRWREANRDSLTTLTGWTIMAHITRNHGLNIWDYLSDASHTSRLCAAARAHIPCCQAEDHDASPKCWNRESMQGDAMLHMWQLNARAALSHCKGLDQVASCKTLATLPPFEALNDLEEATTASESTYAPPYPDLVFPTPIESMQKVD